MTPIDQLKGIGAKAAEKLARLNVRTVEDLLFHLPLRYQDRTRVWSVGELRPGMECQCEGTIVYAKVVFRRRRTLEVGLRDDTDALTLRFFYFSRAQQATLKTGRTLRCFGEVRRGRGGLEMIHPEYSFAGRGAKAAELVYMPVYPTTEGLPQYSLRQFTDDALAWLEREGNELETLLPESEGGLPLKEAIRFIHRPPPEADIELLQQGGHPAQRQLAFEELLAHTLSLRRCRSRMRRCRAHPLNGRQPLFGRLEHGLPFALTAAQKRVIEELRRDLSQPQPMNRLLQGDVGAGKTLVAVAAMLCAVEAGRQAAVMVPTEVLADQFHRNLRVWLDSLRVNVCLITGRQKAAAAKLARRQASTGEAQIVVGTHALFQSSVQFSDLALLVIDEQHRFGVHQRLAFRQKGEADDCQPHQLIMTATPIPRSLAMTMYADLDYSVIDEMPPGRLPTRTVAVPDRRRSEVIERVRGTCGGQRQVYWVCPLIEESEKMECSTAGQTFELLTRQLPGVSVGLIHGRMRTEEKEQAVLDFKQGATQLLVATTVIEVGIDVPNANLIVIENSERFGLAQLHQLRGRVGRGGAQAACVLLYRQPLSENAKRRLDVMRRTTDGFEIAREDLRMRGFGEVLGTRQTGEVRFRVADLMRDSDLMRGLPQYADQVLASGDGLADRLIARWLGGGEQYVEV